MHRNSVPIMLRNVLLGLALIGCQTAHADARKMVLTRPLKTGSVTTYKATIKVNVQGMDIAIDQSQKQTIKTIKDNGTVTIVSEDLGGTLKMNGMETEQKPGGPTTETRDKMGKLLELVHEQDANAPFTPEITKLLSGTSELLMTDKEVGEGDSWETTLVNPVTKDAKVVVKTVYQGIEKVGGVDLWKFKQTAEAVVAADGAKMTNASTIWINPKDGLMEKLDGKVTGLPTQQLGPVDFTILVQRAKPAAADAKNDK